MSNIILWPAQWKLNLLSNWIPACPHTLNLQMTYIYCAYHLDPNDLVRFGVGVRCQRSSPLQSDIERMWGMDERVNQTMTLGRSSPSSPVRAECRRGPRPDISRGPVSNQASALVAGVRRTYEFHIDCRSHTGHSVETGGRLLMFPQLHTISGRLRQRESNTKLHLFPLVYIFFIYLESKVKAAMVDFLFSFPPNRLHSGKLYRKSFQGTLTSSVLLFWFQNKQLDCPV